MMKSTALAACVLGGCLGGDTGAAGLTGTAMPSVRGRPAATPRPAPAAASRSTAAASKTPAACGRIVFRDGFWTGTINVDKARPDLNDHTWTAMNLQMANKSTATVLPDPAGSGQLVARFAVADDGESYRAEIQRKQFGWGHYRYAVSHYVPSDWTPFRYGTIVVQWHGFPMPDANGQGVSLNPPIALALYGMQPKWHVQLARLVSANPPASAVTQYPIDAPVALGRWNDWVFDIVWSRRLADGSVAPGLTVVTLNGREVLRVAADNNYHQQWPPYLQMGIYRSSWRAGPDRGPSGGPPAVVYHRNLVVTDLNACAAGSLQ